MPSLTPMPGERLVSSQYWPAHSCRVAPLSIQQYQSIITINQATGPWSSWEGTYFTLHLQDNGNKTEIFSNNSDLIPPVGVWPRTRWRRRLQRRGPSTGRSESELRVESRKPELCRIYENVCRLCWFSSWPSPSPSLSYPTSSTPY